MAATKSTKKQGQYTGLGTNCPRLNAIHYVTLKGMVIANISISCAELAAIAFAIRHHT